MLQQLRSFDPDRGDLEDVVALSSFAKSFRSEFEHNNLEVPSWLDDKIRELGREIRNRSADNIAMKLKEAKARRAVLRTTEEKRAELDKEIAKLEQMATA
jgi:hypothetical protein